MSDCAVEVGYVFANFTTCLHLQPALTRNSFSLQHITERLQGKPGIVYANVTLAKQIMGSTVVTHNIGSCVHMRSSCATLRQQLHLTEQLSPVENQPLSSDRRHYERHTGAQLTNRASTKTENRAEVTQKKQNIYSFFTIHTTVNNRCPDRRQR